MRAQDVPPTASDMLRVATGRVARLFTPTVRLGVTGLSGAGKTVFITALIRNLLSGGGRLPFFAPAAEGRLLRAYLVPQPDDDVPRFDYEAHVAALGRDPPEWPESTRRISQLRVTIEYVPDGALGGVFGPSKLNLDIVDYPGEWLIDLAMLGETYRAWSAEALAHARDPRRAEAARPFLAFLDTLEHDTIDAEPTARDGARLFSAYLDAARAAERQSVLGPGRFHLPGDYEGSPFLTFFPAEKGPAALRELLAKRYESYKARLVLPFFRDHFSRLDRQIVLVDALAAIDAGPEAVRDLERTLAAVLAAFRPGARRWLAALVGRRIDRVLFAATKADHLNHKNHDRLEALLRFITDRAAARATHAGADIRVIALAAHRATREAEARIGGEVFPSIMGVPLAGERLGDRTFDGRAEAAVFPGDLPVDPRRVLDGAEIAGALRFPRFRPSRIDPDSAAGVPSVAPHIRLDQALEFLLADRL